MWLKQNINRISAELMANISVNMKHFEPELFDSTGECVRIERTSGFSNEGRRAREVEAGAISGLRAPQVVMRHVRDAITQVDANNQHWRPSL